MRYLIRLSQLVILSCGLAFVRIEPVLAIGCSSSEFIDDCREAEEGANQSAQAACMQLYGVGAHPVTGTCHWYGEDDPGSCVENHGENCSCFESYTYDFDCILW